MLLIFLAWIYYTALFTALGFGVVRATARLCGVREAAQDELSLLLPWLGLATVSWLACTWSLVAPVSATFHAAILALTAGVVVVARTDAQALVKRAWDGARSVGPAGLTFAGLVSVMIAFAAADAPVYNLDAGRYHFQCVLWARTFPVVPGLANLHPRFGHSSSFYLIHAMAELGCYEGRSYHIFNGLLLVWLLPASLWGFLQLSRQPASMASAVMVTFGCFLAAHYDYLRSWFLSTLTPDLPANLLVFVTLLYFVSARGSQGRDQLRFYVMLALLGTQAVAIRPTAAPALLVVLWSAAVLQRRGGWVERMVAPCLPVVLLLPMALRNLALSGWLLFPSSAVDLVHADWKLPRGVAEYTLELSRNTAFAEAGEPFPEGLGALRAGLPNLPATQPAITIALGALFLAFVCRPRRTGAQLHKNAAAILIGAGMCLLWLRAAPLFRFGFVYPGICASLLFAAVFLAIDPPRRLLRPVMFAVGVAIAANIVVKSLGVSVRQTRFAYPVAAVRALLQRDELLQLRPTPPARYLSVPLGRISVHLSQRDTVYTGLGRFQATLPGHYSRTITDARGFLCRSDRAWAEAWASALNWSAPLPATAGMLPGLQPRGPRLADGFRIAQGFPLDWRGVDDCES